MSDDRYILSMFVVGAAAVIILVSSVLYISMSWHVAMTDRYVQAGCTKKYVPHRDAPVWVDKEQEFHKQ